MASLSSAPLNSAHGTVIENGTNNRVITLGFTPTAGRKLMLICTSAANHSVTGWSTHLNMSLAAVTTVLTRTADGTEGSTITVVQNGPRNMVWAVYEFDGGVTYSTGAANTGTVSGGWVSGLTTGIPTGVTKSFFTIIGRIATQAAPAGVTATTWTAPMLEDQDTAAVGGSNEAVHQTVAIADLASGTSTHQSQATISVGTNWSTAGQWMDLIVYTVPGNTAPTANAGADQSVAVGSLVTLNGSGSTDADGTIVSYAWTQVSGPSISGLSGSGATRTFTPGIAGTYVFRLDVVDDDGAISAQDTVTITASVGNAAPNANAGADQNVPPNEVVSLSASASTDSDGSIISYVWAQVSGPTVTLSGTGPNRQFTPTTSGTYVFRVTVTDNNGATGQDTVTIVVQAVGSDSIATENAKTGVLASEWFQGLSPLGIQGFGRSTYYLPGQTAQFSVNHNQPFTLQILRMGHYGGRGAREVRAAQAATPVAQPAPVVIPNSNGAVTCAAWSVNASWVIPANAVPGWYMAVFRNTTAGTHGYAMFCVSDKTNKKPVVVVTGDATWHAAYSGFGGNNVYGASEAIGLAADRALCSTYDKPVLTGAHVPQTHFLNATYPFLKWMERMGIEAGHTTIEQIKNDPSILDDRQIVVFAGHNEYVDDITYNKVESLLAKGQKFINAAANDFFWRVKFTDGAFTSSNSGRVMWCKKDSLAGPTAIRGGGSGTPFTSIADWTGTWQDTRWPNRRPSENVFGDQFIANGIRADAVKVPFAMKTSPAWRGCTGVQALTTGQTYTFAAGTLGMEWDRPMMSNPNVQQVMFAEAVVDLTNNAADADGANYTTTVTDAKHGFTMTRSKTYGLIANFNSDQWAWALDALHLRGSAAADVNAMQMMLNIVYDFGVVAHPASVTAASLTVPTPVSNVFTAYGLTDPGAVPGSGGSGEPTNTTYNTLVAAGYKPYVIVKL